MKFYCKSTKPFISFLEISLNEVILGINKKKQVRKIMNNQKCSERDERSGETLSF